MTLTPQSTPANESQNYIYFNIKEIGTAKPLEGATIRILDNGMTQTTNQYGANQGFLLDEDLSYLARVSKPGYWSVDVRFYGNHTETIRVYLTPGGGAEPTTEPTVSPGAPLTPDEQKQVIADTKAEFVKILPSLFWLFIFLAIIGAFDLVGKKRGGRRR
jgi:hypothetical protein